MHAELIEIEMGLFQPDNVYRWSDSHCDQISAGVNTIRTPSKMKGHLTPHLTAILSKCGYQ